MKVALKLFATLGRHLPAEARAASRLELELEPAATVLDVIRERGLPLELCAMVLVNGNFIHREQLASRVLGEGDVVAIWPPVGGG